MEENSFSWLHLSDQHIGMSGSKEYWPQVRDAFFADLKLHIESGNNIDLVIFSGDLVQKGIQDEFKSALNELKLLFDKLAEYGSTPGFFIVPGNHDLVRVDEVSGLPLVVAKAGERIENFKKSVLDGGSNHVHITAVFKNYTKFVNSLRQEGINLLGDVSGVFPGDTSCVLQVNGLRVGLVGLNTAWAQLCGGDYRKKIEVFPEQFSPLVKNSPGSWTAENNLNLLVTHHPVSWFSENSYDDFNSEIFLPKYFDMHVCGHMHEIEALAKDYGDGNIKRLVQGASLFGMDRDSTAKIQRHHGYVYGKVTADDEKLTLWPRKIEKVKHVGWKVSPDTIRLPSSGNSVEFPLKIRAGQQAPKKK
jgi:predicted MPP superfamily phosphohydrolase